MIRAKGTLMPIGGNEDKGHEENKIYSLDFIENSILSRVVSESGGTDVPIVVIPTASSIPDKVGESYLQAFSKLGCNNVEILDIRKKEDSENPDYIKAVESARCIMFSGGNQSKITDKVGGTTLHTILLDRYRDDENIVIAGTSAGAMAMTSQMIAGGSSTEAFQKGAVEMYRGLGLAPNIMFDTHFIQRGRFGRLSEAVAKFPNIIGFGLAEDTGLIIKDGNEIKVIGSGMVIVFDGSSLIHNNEKILDDGTPMTMTNLTVHVLSNSDKFYVDDKTVRVLPINAPFE